MRTAMSTCLRWATAVSATPNPPYTTGQLSSLPSKKDLIPGNCHHSPGFVFPVCQPPFAGWLALCADAPHLTPFSRRRLSLQERIMLRRLLRTMQENPGQLLPTVAVCLFVALGWLYRQATPLLETPDEPAHFAVVNYIAQHHTLPPKPATTRTGPAPTVSADVPFYYAPPLYYGLASLLVGEADTGQFAQAVIPNPNFARGVGLNLGEGAQNKNMYVHTAVQTPPNLAPWAIALNRVRLLSLLFGGITVLGSWALARQLWPRQWRWQATAVALVLFNPTFLYLSNGVSNDALLIALCTWSFVLLVSLWQREDSAVGWREAALFLLLGCAILTKQTGFILLPPALLVLRHRARRRGWSQGRLGALLAGGLLVITAVGGWWYLRNGLLYGDPLALASHNALPPVIDLMARLRFLLMQGWGAFKSYWAAFGWATIFMPAGWYAWFVLLTAVGLTGWWWGKRPSATNPSTIILWFALFLNGGLLIVWLWRTAAPYGRLLFPVIAPLACLLTLGWQRGLARLRWPAWVGQLALGLPLTVLAVLAPAAKIQPAFAPVNQPAGTAAAFTPLDATFAGQFHLLGYTIVPKTAHSGQDVTLTLYWQLAQPPASAHLIETFIQVAPLDAEAQVAATSALLGTSRYPAPFWQANETIVQPYTLTLPEELPVPSLYWFNLVLLDELTQTRLPLTGQGGELLRVGPVPVLSGEEEGVVETAVPIHYTFGPQIQLLGYTLQPAAAGLALTLYWQADTPPTADWTIFVHLVDDAGALVTQGDGLPRDGNFPTSWWPAGVLVPDTHLLAGAAGCDELDGYRLLLGLYNPSTADRLPVHDAAGQPLPNSAIELEPMCTNR
ncbi:MAG: glycosyltransferase family 39 protein [Candidatus Promineifilaceae bacterium]